MRIVNIEALVIGSKLGKPVYATDGRILLTKGSILSETFIALLIEKKIPAVYIDDEISEEVEMKDVIDIELKVKAVNMVKNIFENIGQTIKETNKKSFISKEAFLEMRKTVNLIMDNLKNNDASLINMVEIMSTDLSTYTHCVNVSILAILVGKGLGFDETILMELGIGALLHDIGMVCIPSEILNKPDTLTEEETEIIKKHPLHGYDMVKDDTTISTYVKTIILMHHERLNGTGYPTGLKGEQINTLVRIVSICDIFEALIAERVYRKKLPVYKALELLESYTTSTVDFYIYKVFIKNIAIYPAGTGVILNTGEKGIVIGNNKDYPTRPRVRIVFQEDGSYYPGFKIVDLMETLTLFVEDTCDINNPNK